MSHIPTDQPASGDPGAAHGPARQLGVVPFLAVADGRRAIEWYVEALGAELRGNPIVRRDGRVGHSELWLAGGPMHVADESPASHVAAPRPGADATVSLGAEVADVDAFVGRAIARGASLERPAADASYGRNAVIRDPFGHRWLISSPPAAERVRNGDAGYASLWVPDVERAAGFFSAVLGWTYAPGSAPQGRQVTNTTLPQGIWGGQSGSTLFLAYVVDDLGAAIQRVRAAGGTSAEPRYEPHEHTVDCADDQGTPFAMFQPPAAAMPPRRGLAPARHGDLEYITMKVVDSARARAFYGAVFGWDFTPGRVADGWNVLDPVPMTGMVGGQERALNVPVYHVDEVERAVRRVREAGGTATDPTHEPYGVIAECATPDGTAFSLRQP